MPPSAEEKVNGQRKNGFEKVKWGNKLLEKQYAFVMSLSKPKFEELL
jgi:hypothetical protein